jgi:hypothetical protein
MVTKPMSLSDDTRPRAKFVTAVWGDAYIRRFAALSLPSFLAPGNIPVLAEATELEVVIMTRRDDFERFGAYLAFRRLRTICPVRFVAIDDLVTTGVYGVTLTLAYARAVIECGKAMLDTHFVFMNADFVLADGSLRALSRHILAGRSIVLGPSFRATAEAVEPQLDTVVDRALGVLAIPPRQLATLSMAHPHPTTIAKIVNQGFCHSSHPNQFFWQVDDATLLGRYYLIFMLCLKPERIIDEINCFCDYSFIPEMCPSSDEVAMDDSDEFFMLELQNRDQELQMLWLGRQTDEEIARSLSQWTTAEHRRAAFHDIVFHTREIPPDIEVAKAEARAFVDRIGRKLSAPVPHARHRYWIRAIQAWRRFRKAQGLPVSPPELAQLSTAGYASMRRSSDALSGLVSAFWVLAYGALDMTFGHWPKVTAIHPAWMDSRHLRATLAAVIADPDARMLVVRRDADHIDPLIGSGGSVTYARINDVLDGVLTTSRYESEAFTHALLYLRERDAKHAQRLLERCRHVMSAQGICQLFVHVTHGGAAHGNVSEDLLEHIDDLLPAPWWTADCLFVGGTFKRFITSLIRHGYRSYARIGARALFWILPMLALVMPISLAGNLYQRIKGPSRRFVPDCSSVSIRFAPVRSDSTHAFEPSQTASPADSRAEERS